jgi:DNA-binding transcriptional LysR family regulator
MNESNGLILFLEVARQGSFAEAARNLHQSTTTISRKIQQLESELGARLFHRTTRSVSLTEVGERLLPKARLVIESMRELKGEVDQYSSMPTGTLHISAPSTILQHLASLFSEFSTLYPSIRFNFESSSRYSNLTKHRFDFAFRVGQLSDSSLISLPISTFRNVLVCNKKLVDQREVIAHPSTLVNWPCIRNHIDGFLLPWRFSLDGESVDLESEGDILSDDLPVAVQLAIEGLGVANVPIALAHKYIERGELICILDNWMATERELHLVYSNRQYLPSKSKAFIDFIRSKRTVLKEILHPSFR